MRIVIRLVIYALAVYRVSVMIAQERGPGDVFARLRARVARRWPLAPQQAIDYLTPSDTIAAPGHFVSWQAAGIKCANCVSFWVGIVAGGVFFAVADVDAITLPDAIAAGLAFSAVTVMAP